MHDIQQINRGRRQPGFRQSRLDRRLTDKRIQGAAENNTRTKSAISQKIVDASVQNSL